MCVVWEFSNKSSQDISTLFKHISSDNEIAEKFKIGWTNLIYINDFGLALYFKELPYSKIKVSNWFVILYDESSNKSTQQCLLWFWNEEKKLSWCLLFDIQVPWTFFYQWFCSSIWILWNWFVHLLVILPHLIIVYI